MSEAYLALSPWVQALADDTAVRTAQALSAISGLTAASKGCEVRLLGPAHLSEETLPPGFLAEATLSGEVGGNLLMSMAMDDTLALARTLLGVGADCETMDEISMAAVQEGAGQTAVAMESALNQMTGRQFKVDLKPGSVHDRPIAGSELVSEGEDGIVELNLTMTAGHEGFRLRIFLDLTTVMDIEPHIAAVQAPEPRAVATPPVPAGAAANAAADAGTGAGVAAAAENKGAAAVTGHPTPAFMAGTAGEPRVEPARFSDLAFGASDGDRGNIDLLMDVPLSITVELGRTKRLVRDILGFGPGSVVELDKTAGEALDILVNGRFIARGEVVIVNENFGIRVTEISSQIEKAAGLK